MYNTGVCEINTLFDSRRFRHAIAPLPRFQSCRMNVPKRANKQVVLFRRRFALAMRMSANIDIEGDGRGRRARTSKSVFISHTPV